MGQLVIFELFSPNDQNSDMACQFEVLYYFSLQIQLLVRYSPPAATSLMVSHQSSVRLVIVFAQPNKEW